MCIRVTVACMKVVGTHVTLHEFHAQCTPQAVQRLQCATDTYMYNMCCEGAGEENDMHLHLDVTVSTTPNPKPKRTDFLR